MKTIPISLKTAKKFILEHHRHNKPPVGWKFGIGLENNNQLIGVATAGRPIARAFDNGLTLEINRTCVDGTKNANSKLYGSVIKCAKAMGYKRVITYTQANETGSSLRAVGMQIIKKLPERKSWKESSIKLKDIRDDKGNGGVKRILWQCLL